MKLALLISAFIALLWAFGLYLSFINNVPKSFTTQSLNQHQGKTIRQRQHESIASSEEKRKEYMQQIQDKIRDNNLKGY